MEYVIHGSEAAERTIYRRSAGWRAKRCELDVGEALETAPVTLTYADLYAGVAF